MAAKAVGGSTSVRFRTTLHQDSGRNTTGVIVPDDLLERLAAGRRPPVRVTLNGYEFRTTVGAMGGKAMLSVSAAIRTATGLAGGDAVDVELALDEGPREVDVPADFAAALGARGDVRKFFEALPNSLRRFHVDSINGAKTAETRQRRIEKAIQLFRDGKRR